MEKVRTKAATMGIDIGYSHTKTVTEKGVDNFRSTVRDGFIDINTDSTVIRYNNRDMTIGEYGRTTVDTNKMNDDNFLPLLYTAILRNSDDVDSINVNLVTGLPIAWYQSQKDSLTNMLINKNAVVGYGGRDRKITISNCIVFPQSAGLALNNPSEFVEGRTNLVIDIGGLTVDVSYYEGRKLVSFESYQLGIIKLYARIASAINSRFNVSVEHQDIQRFIDLDSVVVNEREVEFDFDLYFREHVDKIITNIKTDFPYDIVHRKTFVGGGALVLESFLPKNRGIKCDVVQFNAEAFYNVGLQKYE